MSQNNIFILDFFLTAGECDAEGRMPIQLLIGRLIEAASLHANHLGIGYEKLMEMNLAWVLSRVSVEIIKLPQLNEPYRLKTWVESTNRLFSERCFELIDKDGKTAAWARTTWAAIDITSRRPANPAVLGDVLFPDKPEQCLVTAAGKFSSIDTPTGSQQYTFKYCDLDFNRHINTIKYVTLILNYWPLEHYDKVSIKRIDFAFHHECHFGETITLNVADNKNISDCEIINKNIKAVSARILWNN